MSSSSKASSSFFQSTNYAFNTSVNAQNNVSNSFALQDTLSSLSKSLFLVLFVFQSPVHFKTLSIHTFRLKTLASTVLQDTRISSNTCHSSFRLASKSFFVSSRIVSFRFTSRRLLRSYRFCSPFFKHVPFFVLFRFKSFMHRSTSFRFALRRFHSTVLLTLAFLRFVSLQYRSSLVSTLFRFNSLRFKTYLALIISFRIF